MGEYRLLHGFVANLKPDANTKLTIKDGGKKLSPTHLRQGTGKTNPRLAAIFVLLGRNDSGSIQYCCNAVSSLSLAFQNILQLFHIYDCHCWCSSQKKFV